MLQKSTLDFLKKLEKNNNRDWFQTNKKTYEAAKLNFEETVQEILDGLGKYDIDVKGLEAKKSVFRIYRDVRFSANKAPYKNNLAAGFGKGGKKMAAAGYYLHLQPGGHSMLGGGLWMPPAPILNAIRQEIDYNTKEFKSIINNKDFKKYYGTLSDYKLKTTPKNYSKEHPEIELLKYTSFVAMQAISDADLLSPKFVKHAVDALRAIKPMLDFCNRAEG